MLYLVISVVALALILGVIWGLYGRISENLEGFLVAVAGGALLVSAVQELIQPAIEKNELLIALGSVFLGAIVFTGLDYSIKEKFKATKGSGLLAAITLDGIPENLALGVALIGTSPKAVLALAGSIFLSNLPEAAGGAKEMSETAISKKNIFFLWSSTAILLSLATIIGYYFLKEVPKPVLNYIRCFAGGAVIASLSLEVFPKAFKKDKYWAGIATALGAILALYLGTFGE